MLAIDVSILASMKTRAAIEFNSPAMEEASMLLAMCRRSKNLVKLPRGILINFAGNNMGVIAINGAPSGLTNGAFIKPGLQRFSMAWKWNMT